MLVGPVLGRPAGESLVIQEIVAEAQGRRRRKTDANDLLFARGSFEPFLVNRLERPTSLTALTRVCRIGRRPDETPRWIERTLRRDDGSVLESLPPVALELETRGRVRCQLLRDRLPAADLAPGEYRFEVRVRNGDYASATWAEARFAVMAGYAPE